MSMRDVDTEARQRAVAIKITGVELSAMEAQYTNAIDAAGRGEAFVHDGGGRLLDMARLATHYAEAEASARDLYRITGSLTWRTKSEAARQKRSTTLMALGQRETPLRALSDKYAPIEAANPNMAVLERLVAGIDESVAAGR